MPVSKRLRYEVFRRDNFICRYCGAKAPDVQLTTDHVVPVALGGTDDPANLVTACGPCNSGKTSTSPDAPVVADVSADALRWSRALAEAARRMHVETAGRAEIYDEFDGWWGRWGLGPAQEPVPRPNDWRSSIDSFLAAGLPLEVLEWCVNRAMGSQVKTNGIWRYMCGIAWRKVTELQETARDIASGADNNGTSNPQDGCGDSDAIRDRRSLIQALGVVLGRVEGGGTALESAHAQLEAERGSQPDYPEWYCLAVRILTSNEPVRIGDIL